MIHKEIEFDGWNSLVVNKMYETNEHCSCTLLLLNEETQEEIKREEEFVFSLPNPYFELTEEEMEYLRPKIIQPNE